MTHRIRTAALAALLAAVAAPVFSQVTFYEQEGFRGRAFSADRPIGDFSRYGFNDRASSVVVERGRWEVCDDARFQGQCVVLRRGNYDSLRSLGLNNRISSVRPVSGRGQYANEPPPPAQPVPAYEWRVRPSEQLFQVPVRDVRAVMGPPEQRCWVERQQVQQAPLNVPGAVIGGVLGGILGHQIGKGSGNTVATIGGAVGGGAIGANIDRFGNPGSRDVRRCENVAAGGPPQYWDVAYVFRGVEHHAQMSSPPGPTITVNGRGEPRQ